MHASKLNAMIKKKISYMINEDFDVAKDFLDLVEILKQHKSRISKSLKENIIQKVQQDDLYNENIFVDNQQNYLLATEMSP